MEVTKLDMLSLESQPDSFKLSCNPPVNKPEVKSHHTARQRKKLHIGEFSKWSVDLRFANMPIRDDELEILSDLPSLDFFCSDMVCTEVILLLGCEPVNKKAIQKQIDQFIHEVSEIMDYNTKGNVVNKFVVADNWYSHFDY